MSGLRGCNNLEISSRVDQKLEGMVRRIRSLENQNPPGELARQGLIQNYHENKLAEIEIKLAEVGKRIQELEQALKKNRL